jgi:formate hydrogenlyase transcriptional activator
LLESELFGHEKGAFTGAIAQKVGRFELADRGTLFLDEVGDLPLELQPKLLRVLQEQEFERLGGTRTTRVDVRVVAATNSDLSKLVAERAFRSDLYYRLNVFPIQIPALRERPEDIPLLVRYFVQRFSRSLNKEVEYIPADAMDALSNYSWPGNIRELGAVIDRAAILGNGERLEVAKALGFASPAAPPAGPPLPTMYEVIPEAPQPLSPNPTASIGTLAAAMKEHIERSLVATHGKIEGRTGTAALLGINPHTLRARMRKLGIDWSRFRTP